MAQQDVGVPGAVARALRQLAERVPPERIDRVWIFPPLTRGRSESGIVAAGCFAGGERRTLVTVAYTAEESGKGIVFEPRFQEEGEAPSDRLHRVIEGVVHRSAANLPAPRGVDLGGDPEAFFDLVREWSSSSVAGTDGNDEKR